MHARAVDFASFASGPWRNWSMADPLTVYFEPDTTSKIHKLAQTLSALSFKSLPFPMTVYASIHERCLLTLKDENQIKFVIPPGLLSILLLSLLHLVDRMLKIVEFRQDSKMEECLEEPSAKMLMKHIFDLGIFHERAPLCYLWEIPVQGLFCLFSKSGIQYVSGAEEKQNNGASPARQYLTTSCFCFISLFWNVSCQSLWSDACFTWCPEAQMHLLTMFMHVVPALGQILIVVRGSAQYSDRWSYRRTIWHMTKRLSQCKQNLFNSLIFCSIQDIHVIRTV